MGYCGNYEPALAWARDYLGSYFDLEPGGDGGPMVAGLVNADLHAALMAALAGAEGEPARTHTSRLTGPGPRWEWQTSRRFHLDGDLTIQLLDQGGGIVVSDRGTEEFAFVAPRSADEARFEPVRMVRELFIRQLEQQGYVVVHAGAVMLGDSAVVVCGPRGAGKTTLICGLLEYEGARFVSNVRTFLRVDAEGVADVVAWPWSVRIGFGTCAASAALRGWLEADRALTIPQKDWDVAGALESSFERYGGWPESGVIEAKAELTAAELATLMGTDVVSGAPAARLVFPELAPAAETAIAAEIEPSEAAARLQQQRAKVVDDVHADWLDLGLESRNPESPGADSRLSRFAAACPAVRLPVGDARRAARAVAGLAVPA